MDDKTKSKLIQIAEGVIVEDDVLGIVKAIQLYDSNLVVQFADPDRAEFFDAPYRIVEVCPDGFRRVVLTCWKLDKTILERLFAADNKKHDVLLSLEGKNLLAKREQQRRYEEQRGLAKDIIIHVLKSPKTTYTAVDELNGHRKLITFSDHKEWEKPAKELD